MNSANLTASIPIPLKKFSSSAASPIPLLTQFTEIHTLKFRA